MKHAVTVIVTKVTNAVEGVADDVETLAMVILDAARNAWGTLLTQLETATSVITGLVEMIGHDAISIISATKTMFDWHDILNSQQVLEWVVSTTLVCLRGEIDGLIDEAQNGLSNFHLSAGLSPSPA